MNPDAGAKQGESPVPKKNSAWHAVREWVQVIVIALIIALPIRWLVAEPFIVNGASMDPTFATGQFLIVDRLTYDFSAPKRGDVIVFEYPNDPSVYWQTGSQLMANGVWVQLPAPYSSDIVHIQHQ